MGYKMADMAQCIVGYNMADIEPGIVGWKIADVGIIGIQDG